jgi:hypothetical protein
MPDRHKAKLEQNTTRVTNWLIDHRAEFEQQGINEDTLTSAAELGSAEEVKAAIDHLENREAVVRWPEALTRPPRFVLKPGRHWSATRDKLLGTQSASRG